MLEGSLGLQQSAVISRSAFRATLQIANDDGTNSMQDVLVTVGVRDASGNDATSLFGLNQPTLTGIGDVDGSGAVLPGGSAKIEWLIVPSNDAAPTEPVSYSVSGLMHYSMGGVQFNIPLYPASITVLPNPRLRVKYFLERTVYSDDPFTPVAEPAVPFSLGLLVKNEGAGIARDMQITSGMPQIETSDRQLVVNFQFVGAQVGAKPVSPSLKVALGDIDAGAVVTARWLMTASLEGEFKNFTASFQHTSALGIKSLSLIESVETHDLIHAVRLDRPTDDSIPDFLANDTPDTGGMADVVHSSDGSVLPVAAVTIATVDGAPQPGRMQVQLTANMPAGWSYLQIDDPSGGQYPLTRLVRSDGREVRIGDNAWTTHRVIRLKDQPPRPEHLLRLVDFDSTGSYTLAYGGSDPADLNKDGQINARDFAILRYAFGHGTGDHEYDPAADMDHNGEVSFSDYQLWLQAYRLAVGDPQAPPPTLIYPADLDHDSDIDKDDISQFVGCMSGPAVGTSGAGCGPADLDSDGDVDQADFGLFQPCFGQPGAVPPPHCVQ